MNPTLQTNIENLQTLLNDHSVQLRKNLETHMYRIMHKFEDELHHKETQRIVEEHAAVERAIQNNGWVDFDPENTKDLIDDETYLIRYLGMDDQWRCPHLAFWDSEDQQFSLLHSTTFMAPIVHQYFKVPE